MAKQAYSLAVILVAASVATGSEPWFCHDLDCPAYTVIAEKEGYEVRAYNASKWVGTKVVSENWDAAGEAGFNLLFDYISGQNAASEKVPMTAPVAIQVTPGPSPANYTVFFFIPYAYQENTPAPTNPAVFLANLPKLTAYVIQYGGFPSDSSVTKYEAELASYLQRDQTSYVKGVYFTGTYDPPFRIIDRHNEVWLLAP